MKIACCQFDVVFGDPQANTKRLISAVEASDADLLVFPEAFLTGYCVGDRVAAADIAIDPHASVELEEISELAKRTGKHIVVGYAAKQGDRLSNAATLFLPSGERCFYEKTHLPYLGLDRFVEPGHSMPIFDTVFGRVGILICYDLRPPEACRVMALSGVDLIVLPTNWPNGAEVAAGHTCVVRAAENKIFLATCDRAGTENGFSFIGLSKIISPYGKILASAGSGEEVISAEIDLAEARDKRNVLIPGEYELALFESRRPELYGALLKSDL